MHPSATTTHKHSDTCTQIEIRRHTETYTHTKTYIHTHMRTHSHALRAHSNTFINE